MSKKNMVSLHANRFANAQGDAMETSEIAVASALILVVGIAAYTLMGPAITTTLGKVTTAIGAVK
ncbi:MAG: hypothetical protein RRX88_04625 [Raoultibacter sp.]